MNLVRKEFKFCYAHQLFNSYTKLCQGLHGHNAKLEVFLSAKELDDTGMVIDFTQVKDMFKNFIDDVFDHSLLLPKMLEIIKPNYVSALKENNMRVIIWDCNPTAENMSRIFFEQFAAKLLEQKIENVTLTKVRVWETESGYAEYRGGCL